MTYRRIYLIRNASSTSTLLSPGHRVIITATDAYLMDENVFVFKYRPINPSTPTETTEVYLGVATPEQLSELTVDAPTDDDQTEAFLKSSIDKTFDDPQDAEDFWTTVVDQVTSLKLKLDSLDILSVSQQLLIGYPP